MPTLQEQPIDVQWYVGLVSGITVYPNKASAIAAATTLSAANANSPVQIAQVFGLATSSGGSGKPQFDLPGGIGAGVSQWVVQLASATTYYPLATARGQAQTVSAANANAPVIVARVTSQVTAP